MPMKKGMKMSEVKKTSEVTSRGLQSYKAERLTLVTARGTMSSRSISTEIIGGRESQPKRMTLATIGAKINFKMLTCKSNF